MLPYRLACTLLTLYAFFLPAAHAFAFNFTAPPTACANATVQWAGGTAPFQLLLVPTGALHPEVRVIAAYTIASGTSFSFPLTYPGNSTFVAVFSDATGFGAGGTTPVTAVAPAKDTSCLKKNQVAPEFFIFTNPPVPEECAPMMISYNTDAHPPVDVYVVIPGGASERIVSGSPTNRSFEWMPVLREGTQMMLVAGDTSGMGKGGSTDILTVAAGNSTACLDAPSTNTTSTTATTPSSTQTPSGATSCLSSLSLWTVLLGLLLVPFQ